MPIVIYKRIHQPDFDILHVGCFEITGSDTPHHSSPPFLRITQFTVPVDIGRKVVGTFFRRIVSHREGRNNIHIPDSQILIREQFRLPDFADKMVRTLFLVGPDMGRIRRRHAVKNRIDNIPGQFCPVVAVIQTIRLAFRKQIILRGRSQFPLRYPFHIQRNLTSFEVVQVSVSTGSTGCTRLKPGELGVYRQVGFRFGMYKR